MANRSSLASHRRDWEELASVDARWAVLTNPSKRNRWGDSEFFAIGDREIAWLMQTVEGLGYPKQFRTALDFGCGVGRLTRALSKHFQDVWGVDISSAMLKEAENNVPKAHFILNETNRLPFADASFDLIYTAIVLQHLPRPRLIADYIGEFLRTIRPGGVAVFHVPTHVQLLHRIQPRRRVYGLLRALGMAPRELVDRNLTPMRVIALPEKRILEIVRQSGCRVVHVDDVLQRVSGTVSKTFFVART